MEGRGERADERGAHGSVDAPEPGCPPEHLHEVKGLVTCCLSLAFRTPRSWRCRPRTALSRTARERQQVTSHSPLSHLTVAREQMSEARTGRSMHRNRAARRNTCGLVFGVWGLGFGVWGVGCGVWGLGFGVWGLGFGI